MTYNPFRDMIIGIKFDVLEKSHSRPVLAAPQKKIPIKVA